MTDTPAALKSVRAEISTALDERAAARAERNGWKEKIKTGSLNPTNMQAAEASVARVAAAEEKLEGLRAQERTFLQLMGEAVESTPGENGPTAVDGDNAAAVKYLTKTPGALLSAMLEKRKGEIPTLSNELKAKASSFEMTAPTQITTSSISTTTETDAVIDLLHPQSVAIASGIGVYPIDTTKVKIPRFSQLPEAKWIAELGEFPESAPAIEMVERDPPKVGLISPLSIEVFEDLSPLALAMTQTQILRAIGLAYDRGILFGSGENNEPRGVAKTAGIAALEVPPLRNFGAFAQAIGALLVSNSTPRALVMNPMDVAKLLEAVEWRGGEDEAEKEKEVAASNIPLWKASVGSASGLVLPYFGIPVWPTPACPKGEALMYDPAQIVAVIRRKADIAVDPYYDFKKGKIGLRSFLRGDVVVGQPGAVVRIEFES